MILIKDNDKVEQLKPLEVGIHKFRITRINNGKKKTIFADNKCEKCGTYFNSADCPLCKKIMNQEKQKDNWGSFMWSTYHLSREDYLNLIKKQHNKCAICGLDLNGKSVVDHDHQTGRVRGILCNSCNTGIGLLKDDPQLLIVASEYIRKAFYDHLDECRRGKGGKEWTK